MKPPEFIGVNDHAIISRFFYEMKISRTFLLWFEYAKTRKERGKKIVFYTIEYTIARMNVIKGENRCKYLYFEN